MHRKLCSSSGSVKAKKKCYGEVVSESSFKTGKKNNNEIEFPDDLENSFYQGELQTLPKEKRLKMPTVYSSAEIQPFNQSTKVYNVLVGNYKYPIIPESKLNFEIFEKTYGKVEKSRKGLFISINKVPFREVDQHVPDDFEGFQNDLSAMDHEFEVHIDDINQVGYNQINIGTDDEAADQEEHLPKELEKEFDLSFEESHTSLTEKDLDILNLRDQVRGVDAKIEAGNVNAEGNLVIDECISVSIKQQGNTMMEKRNEAVGHINTNNTSDESLVTEKKFSDGNKDEGKNKHTSLGSFANMWETTEVDQGKVITRKLRIYEELESPKWLRAKKPDRKIFEIHATGDVEQGIETIEGNNVSDNVRYEENDIKYMVNEEYASQIDKHTENPCPSSSSGDNLDVKSQFLEIEIETSDIKMELVTFDAVELIANYETEPVLEDKAEQILKNEDQIVPICDLESSEGCISPSQKFESKHTCVGVLSKSKDFVKEIKLKRIEVSLEKNETKYSNKKVKTNKNISNECLEENNHKTSGFDSVKAAALKSNDKDVGGKVSVEVKTEEKDNHGEDSLDFLPSSLTEVHKPLDTFALKFGKFNYIKDKKKAMDCHSCENPMEKPIEADAFYGDYKGEHIFGDSYETLVVHKTGAGQVKPTKSDDVEKKGRWA